MDASSNDYGAAPNTRRKAGNTRKWASSIDRTISSTYEILRDVNKPIISDAWTSCEVPTINQATPSSAAVTNILLTAADPQGSTDIAPVTGSSTRLLERVLQSEQTIKSLTLTVQTLREERSQQGLTLARQQAQLDELCQRLSEKGVDMTTERKYNAWKESVEAKVQALMEQHDISSRDQAAEKYNTQAITALSDEFRSFKATIRKEIDTICSQLAGLRSTLSGMQGDIASQALHFRHVAQRSDEAYDQASGHTAKTRELMRAIQHNSEEIERLLRDHSELRKGAGNIPKSKGAYHRLDAAGGMFAFSTPHKSKERTDGTVDNVVDEEEVVPSFEDMKLRWARRRQLEANESSLMDSLDLTLNESLILKRAVGIHSSPDTPRA